MELDVIKASFSTSGLFSYILMINRKKLKLFLTSFSLHTFKCIFRYFFKATSGEIVTD